MRRHRCGDDSVSCSHCCECWWRVSKSEAHRGCELSLLPLVQTLSVEHRGGTGYKVGKGRCGDDSMRVSCVAVVANIVGGGGFKVEAQVSKLVAIEAPQVSK